MTEPLLYSYNITFADGEEVHIPVTIDPHSIVSDLDLEDLPPEWTRRDYVEDPDYAALPHAGGLYCPIALRLVKPLALFGNRMSIERVRAVVRTPERDYVKECDLQTVLGSLFGLLMATSGSPAMAVFRPMARFHLPFASLQESLYRVASMLLLQRYFTHGERGVSLALEDVREIYRRTEVINRNMIQRLRVYTEKDSTLNAMVILSSLSFYIPATLEEGMEELRELFQVAENNLEEIKAE